MVRLYLQFVVVLMSFNVIFFWFQCGGVQRMLCFCFVFLRLLCPVLSVSLDCPFLIAPSVFSNVYFSNSFQCYFLSRPRLYCYRFLPNTLREPGTSKSYRVKNDDNVTNVHVFKQNQNGTMKNVSYLIIHYVMIILILLLKSWSY